MLRKWSLFKALYAVCMPCWSSQQYAKCTCLDV